MFNVRATFPTCVAATIFLLGVVSRPAAATVRIIGSLGNFDVHNESGHECNEFDIELEGPHPEDVTHTYRNGNYGSPTITALPGNIGIRVVYAHPNHATAPGVIEHFGVSLNYRHPITAQRFQWIPGTVNVPDPPPPPPPPPPLPLPRIRTEVVQTQNGPVIRETCENVDTYGRLVWVLRRETVASREVALEELMPEDPLIQGSNQVDLEPELVAPGTPLIIEEPAPSPGDTESEVIAYEVYSNTRRIVGGEWTDVPGTMIGTILTAAVTQSQPCTDLCRITTQPVSVTAPFDGAAEFTLAVAAPPAGGTPTYQWRHEGVSLDGEDTPLLRVDPVTDAEAGAYTCAITNDCGTVLSDAAYLTVCHPATIANQPANVTACAGGNATFSVTATGSLPMSPQWRKGTTNIVLPDPHYSVGVSSDGTAHTLTIVGLTSADAGTGNGGYRVVLTNGCGSDTSDVAELTVIGNTTGDVNGDSVLDGRDVQLFVSTLMSSGPLNSTRCAADIDHSGVVDSADVPLFVAVLLAR